MKSLKRIAVVMLVALLSAGVANAGLRFGVKLGTNVNHISANLKENFTKNNMAGFTGGVMAEYITPLLGFGFDLGVQYAYMNSEANKNYIQIPLNIKYKIGLPVVGSFLAPYIFTGPSFDFKLDNALIQDVKTKTFQPAWNVGLGLELVKHLQIGASYGFGMNNILAEKVLGAEPVKYHNNYWTISAAYLF